MKLNSSGFSLAGVLVAVGVGSIVVVGMMSVINNLQSGQNGVKFRTDADVINEEIRALLSSGPACAATFGGLTAAAGQRHQLTALKNGAGGDVYVVGGKYGDRTLLVNELLFDNFQPGATVLNGSMTLSNNFGTAKGAMGAQAVNRTVAISVELDAAQKIVSCIALARMSDGIWQRSSVNINNIYFTSPVPAGRVGIGTTDPTDMFHIVRNGAGQQANMRLTSDNQSQIVLSSRNNFLYFHDPSAPLDQKYSRLSSRGGVTQLDIMDDVPSTSPLRVPIVIQHSTGNVGIGTSTPSQILETVTTDSARRTIISALYTGNGPHWGGAFATRAARGTPAAPGAVRTADQLGYFAMQGYDGNIFAPNTASPGMTAYATQDWATNAHGNNLGFVTTANGSNAGAIRMLIDHNGNVGIGISPPQVKLDVAGPVRPGAGITGGACPAEGAFAFDFAGHVPVFCSNTLRWTRMGGMNTFFGLNDIMTGCSAACAASAAGAVCIAAIQNDMNFATTGVPHVMRTLVGCTSAGIPPDGSGWMGYSNSCVCGY